MAGRRTPEEIQRILNQPNPLVPTETIGVRLGALEAVGAVAAVAVAANFGQPQADPHRYVRTVPFEPVPLPVQRAIVVCLFGFFPPLLPAAIRDAVRRPARSFDDQETANGHALALKPASIKWSDAVRIDEAQKEVSS